VDFAPTQARDFEDALRRNADSLRIAVRCERSVSDASYHPDEVHAIVFSLKGTTHVAKEDVDTIRFATSLGTCRVYFSDAEGIASLPEGGPLDDIIQRTQAYGHTAVANEITSFFREADSLNRRNTILAFRDMTCLAAYSLLKYLWPISYVFAAIHILNATTALVGRGEWLGHYVGDYVVSASTFFGAFFITHCIFTVVRNWLFAVRIAKRAFFSLARSSAGFGIAAAATIYSIAVTDHNAPLIFMSAVLAIGAYAVYIYARRIRAECTALSQLQTTMAYPHQRNNVLRNIGEKRFGHSAFPLFPFQNRSLFISYMHGSQWSSDTAALIQQWACSKHDLEVFLDRSTIPPGSLWRQSLLRAVSQCGFFVTVIDGDSPITEWVLAESAYAALLR